MKIIHTADLHLGSPIDSKLQSLSSERKAEIRNSFSRLCQYARNNAIQIILLSGDTFDSDHPFKKDKKYFYDIIKANSDISFYYLRGNHDLDRDSQDKPANLYLFEYSWTSYELEDNIVLSGIERTKKNNTSFYDTRKLNPDKTNVVLLHGALSDSLGQDRICLKKLKEKNIDYLALGHIHSYQGGKIDDRGIYCYPGCLQGRGFDEIGEKGFVLLDIKDKKVSSSFVPFSKRVIREETVDISHLTSIYEIISQIKKQVSFKSEDIYRIILTGDIPIDNDFNELDISKELGDICRFINIKNRTNFDIDYQSLGKQFSLKGEFVRNVREDTSLTEEDKKEIITLGVRALERKELD